MPTSSTFLRDYLTGNLAGSQKRFRGADNGFFTYDVSSPDDGVTDSTAPAFSDFFNRGQTDTPAFDAMTDMYRSSFAPLAQRVRKTGEWAAVQALENNESRLTGLRHLYDIGRSAGVNDRTAAAGVRATLKVVNRLSDRLGSSDMAYADRYQAYITGQALNRGYFVEDLEAEEGELDEAFIQALSASRSVRLAAGSPGSARYSDMLAGTQGSSDILSLRARTALQDYERRHGLYSLEDRMEVLSEAARLVDRVHSNETLRGRFAGRMDQIVDMAARKVLNRDLTPNLFDRIDGAIASIGDGYVSYSGSAYSDLSKGFVTRDARGHVVHSGLSSLVQKGLMDQAVDDEVYGYDPGRRQRSLRDRFEGLLSSYYRKEAMGVDARTAKNVYGAMADKLVDMDRNGHIDLSKLAETFVPITPTADTQIQPVPLKTTRVFGSMNRVGERVLDALVGSRPGIYGGFWGSLGSSLGITDSRDEEARMYTDPGAVRAQVERMLMEGFTADRVAAEDVEAHRKAVSQMTEWLTKAVVDVNTMESGTLGFDPKNVVSGADVRGVKERALRAVSANLALSSRLEELGFKDVPTLAFASVGNPDKSPLRNYADRRDPYANAFIGLIGYLRDQIGKVDPDKLTDGGDYVRYHTALSLAKGLEAAVDSGIGGSDDVKALRDTRRKIANAGIGFDLFDGFKDDALDAFNPYSLAGVQDAMTARNTLSLASAIAAKDVTGTGVAGEQRMLNRILARGFSDKTNPVFEEKMKSMAAVFMERYGKYLEGETRQVYLNKVMDAVGTAMKDVGVLTEHDGTNGQGHVVVFDPMALTLGNTKLEDTVERRIKPVLESVQAVNDRVVQRNLAFQEAKAEAARLAAAKVKAMEENGQLTDMVLNRTSP